MNLIDVITDSPYQTFTMITDKQERVDVTLRYFPRQQGWFMDLQYEPTSFYLSGLRLCTSDNLLSQWKKILPFGIRITTQENQEPYLVNSFSDGLSSFYLLNEGEI